MMTSMPCLSVGLLLRGSLSLTFDHCTEACTASFLGDLSSLVAPSAAEPVSCILVVSGDLPFPAVALLFGCQPFPSWRLFPSPLTCCPLLLFLRLQYLPGVCTFHHRRIPLALSSHFSIFEHPAFCSSARLVSLALATSLFEYTTSFLLFFGKNVIV